MGAPTTRTSGISSDDRGTATHQLLGSLCVLSGWVGLLVLLGLGLPMHVCMPLWCDSDMFDAGARALLRGGRLYQEVFYYVPPGMMFAQATVRTVVGWRSEALRFADFLIVAASVALLVRTALPPGRFGARVWAACLLLFFYMSSAEVCHCQPDYWMLLPALFALVLRIRQAERMVRPNVTPRSILGLAALEGTCWGLAFIFKPFVALPGLTCWLLAVLWTCAGPARRAQRILLDFVGLLAGGLLVGGSIVVWLFASGNWPYFAEALFGDWNTTYYTYNASILLARARDTLLAPLPWSMAHLLAVPLALISLVHSLRRRVGSARTDSFNFALPLLAAFYLGWLVQANFLQRQFPYHQAPAVLLALTVLVSHTGLVGWGAVRSLALVSLLFWAGYGHPILDPDRLAYWGQCWTAPASPELRDALALSVQNRLRPTFADLEQVAEYLRRQNVGDREVTCFSIATLPLYENLGIAPSTRFVQIRTSLDIHPNHRSDILVEMESSPQRFVVWDVREVTQTPKHEQKTLRVPAQLSNQYRFLRYPVVYRAGRYVVFRTPRPEEATALIGPLGDVIIPATISVEPSPP